MDVFTCLLNVLYLFIVVVLIFVNHFYFIWYDSNNIKTEQVARIKYKINQLNWPEPEWLFV